MPKQTLLNYAWYIFIRPQREGGRSCDQHVSHYHVWNYNEISNGWTTNWKQVYCHSREGVAGIFWCLMFFAELHRLNDCSEYDSLHAIPKQGCYNRKVSHLCVYCSAAEEKWLWSRWIVLIMQWLGTTHGGCGSCFWSTGTALVQISEHPDRFKNIQA